MAVPQYGDYQYGIYFDGLDGRLPKYPVDFASLERAAAEVLDAVHPTWRLPRQRSGLSATDSLTKDTALPLWI